MSIKGMKLTKLSAAWLPEWICRLVPAPVDGMDAGTASQLIPGVGGTQERKHFDSIAYDGRVGRRLDQHC